MSSVLQTVADGVHVGALFPRHLFNTVVVDGPEGAVVIDAGFPWSARRLARFLHGRDVVEHAVTHAHGDHVGSSAWLCARTGAGLAMSSVEADGFERGSVAWHSGAIGRFGVAPLARQRRPVDRRLEPGDTVAGFEVIAQPGHSPGLLAFWRAADRLLIVGDGPINVSTDPAAPRWLPLPAGLHHDPVATAASRRRMADLGPALVVSTHGHPVRGDRWAAGR